MAQTSIDYGIVNCPAYRYHPAIIAQAAATLDEMFPGRFWMCPGSGQALNESITGERWPAKPERNTRLKECVDIMQALWRGETVTHQGLVQVEKAKLYTPPKEKIRLIGAAITPETAAWVAGWADGLITVSQPQEKLEKVVEAWRKHGGADKPMSLKVQLSYDETDEEARTGAHEQWKANVFASDLQAELRTPKQFDQAAEFVRPEEMDGAVNISSDPEKHIQWLEKYVEMGFTQLDLHNVNRKQEQFIRVFGEAVLPHFQGR